MRRQASGRARNPPRPADGDVLRLRYDNGEAWRNAMARTATPLARRTSPRARGEVGIRACNARIPGEGASPRVRACGRPLTPTLSPTQVEPARLAHYQCRTRASPSSGAGRGSALNARRAPVIVGAGPLHYPATHTGQSKTMT